MFGFLIGLSSLGSILADRKYFIPVFVTVSWFSKNTNSVFLISQNEFWRTKTGQKAVHCAHLTYIVPINVKYCGFGGKITEFPFYEIRCKNGN